MNLPALKAYAPKARRDFIQSMTDRAAFYGIKQEGTSVVVLPIVEKGDSVVIGGRAFPRKVGAQRKALEQRIQEHGFQQTMEAIAYTWFNRLVAIRYMEVQGYLDHGYRVLSPSPHKASGDERLPEILNHAEHLDLQDLSPQTVIDLKLDGTKDAQLYRLILLAQCHVLHVTMPFIFPRIDDETELLLPENLLHSDSLIRNLADAITDDDCANVEVLGWLYQFYIAEKKKEVMGRKKAVPTDDIPAVTQLFTPHWIVRYLVENSLGRLWLLNRPDSGLRAQMPYYIEGEKETDFFKIAKPEEIHLIDPAVGSGHMLSYAFDLLYAMYVETGHAPAEIPALILEHNLHGVDICPRAAQLAALTLVLKAREKSRRFFVWDRIVQPRILALQNVRFAESELRDYFSALKLDGLLGAPILELLRQFENATTVGSLIQPCLDEQSIALARRTIEATDLGGQLFLRPTHIKVLRALEQAEMLTQRYQVVVENPPYCGARYMNEALASFAKDNFRAGVSDLFSLFILRSRTLSYPLGLIGVVCPFVWMFLSDYEELRKLMLIGGHFDSMIRLEYNAFEPACVPVSCWLYSVNSASLRDTWFIDLSAFKGWENQAPRALGAIANRGAAYNYFVDCREFLAIPSAPFAYEVSKAFRKLFSEHGRLGDLVQFTGSQNVTGSNKTWVRKWWEVSRTDSGHNARWVNYAKGGGSRRWWGLLTDVVDWSDNAKAFYRRNKSSNLLGESFCFRPGVTYSELTSNQPTFRLLPDDCVYDKAGPSFHPPSSEVTNYLLALCNCAVGAKVFDVLNPTMHVQVRDVKNVPIAPLEEAARSAIASIASCCVEVARADWDSFETSWNFRDSPFLRHGLKGATVETSWTNWETYSPATVNRMQDLETDINRIFLDGYGLGSELQPEVPVEQITLLCNPANRYRKKTRTRKSTETESGEAESAGTPEERASYPPEQLSALFQADAVREFLSYAVGCMMGRFSLDRPGLILADAGDSIREYLAKVRQPHDKLRFAPDEDGIIPVLDAERFADDIVLRTCAFLNATFGPETREENVKFIEAALGKDLRKYFLTDFYRYHLQAYKKRPIYWMFTSGRQRSFQCLVYLHRYNDGTLARMRTEYVIPLQGQIAACIDEVEAEKLKATSTSRRRAVQKEQDTLRKQQAELLVFDEKLKHAADQKIALDLDDGVKVNYEKFGDLLAEVDTVTGGSDE